MSNINPHQDLKNTSINNVKNNNFNWYLPLFGAIGFGIAFRITCGFSSTIFNIATNSFAEAIPGTKVGIEIGLLRGLIIGALGGTSLLLAYKEKFIASVLAITGAIGFAASYIIILSINSSELSELGRIIVQFIPIHHIFPVNTQQIIHGIGMGLIFGLLCGFILGLGAPKKKIYSAIALSIAGGIVFTIAFIIAHKEYNSSGLCNLWDLWGGVFVGSVFGFVLELLNLKNNKK